MEQHKYNREDAMNLMRSGKFRSFAEMVDIVNRDHYVSYQSFINYIDGRSTGLIKREAIETFFDEHLGEQK